MTAYLQSAALLALALLAVAVADACAPAYLALVPMSVVLAYLQSAALLALALYALVVADTCKPAYLALVPLVVMLAYLRSATLLLRGWGGRFLSPRISCTCSYVGYSRISAIRHTPCTSLCGCGGRSVTLRILCTLTCGDCAGTCTQVFVASSHCGNFGVVYSMRSEREAEDNK
jgi:hypothetical protein